MLKTMLAAYERGYRDGLRQATALLEDKSERHESQPIQNESSPSDAAQPAYHEGFRAGVADGAEVIRALRYARRAL